MTRNAFDEFFADDLKSPAGEEHYNRVRAQIDAVDMLFRDMDARRKRLGWSKAELARRAGLNPVMVRRLFSQQLPNPTLQTVVALASALEATVSVTADGALRDAADEQPRKARTRVPAASGQGRV